jgi:Domain of unknown function DUF83
MPDGLGPGATAADVSAAEPRSVPPFLPVRMLNEFTYCPRLGYLEWVQGEFADSADTVEGRFHHRNVDRTRQRRRPSGDGEEEAPSRIHERSVLLGSEALGLSAKIDLIEGEGNRVVPVDYKRGKRRTCHGGRTSRSWSSSAPRGCCCGSMATSARRRALLCRVA